MHTMYNCTLSTLNASEMSNEIEYVNRLRYEYAYKETNKLLCKRNPMQCSYLWQGETEIRLYLKTDPSKSLDFRKHIPLYSYVRLIRK